MVNPVIKYSAIVLVRPTKDWQLEALFFKIDGKYEFLRQWVDTKDNPIKMIMDKLFRITGVQPEIISLEPVYTHQGEEFVEYYCAILTPHQKIAKTKYYDDALWQSPRKLFTSLHRIEERGALLAGVAWAKSDDFAPLIMLRNKLFIK